MLQKLKKFKDKHKIISMKIVILEIPHAQESNQLIQHVHFDAYCNLNGAIFVNPKFDYLSLNSIDKKCFLFRLYVKILTLKYIRKILIKFRIADYYRFYAPHMQDNFNISRITYVKGWYFRSNVGLLKYKSFYIDKFNSRLLNDNFFENKRDLFVAVHIRRGDYINFLDGRYYLDDNQYITALKNVTSEINTKFKVIIFGNDPKLNKELYYSLGFDLKISEGTIYEDYYRMSKCDILIGPSSTFSIWAKFISNDKLKKIVIDRDNFDKVRLENALQ